MEPSHPVPVPFGVRASNAWAMREALNREERSDAAVRARDARVGAQGSSVLCVACRHGITHGEARIEVAGAHRHTFANPHGFVFSIGCFSSAPGCFPVGMPSNEFAWFAGTSWQVVVCGRCGVHLGWCFRSSDRSFHGLILDRVVEEAGQRHESR